MELSQEINQLLLCCKDKQYIKANLDNLKAYFSMPQNINLLKFALTTNKNFTALKIIEKLDLQIVPYIHINSFTFVSVYWLYKMKVVNLDEFESFCKKFRILKNFDFLLEETERKFMQLQIEKRRRILRCNYSGASTVHHITSAMLKQCDTMTFIFYLDDLFNIEKYIESFIDLRNGIFFTDLKSFEEFPNDPERIIKQNRFKELKGRLMNCSIRNFTNFFSLDNAMQGKLEELMNALSRIRRCGFKYYICSRRPLSSIVTFCYLYVNCIDLTKIIEVHPGQELNLPVYGRKVVFINDNVENIKNNININNMENVGNKIPYEFLKETMSNLTRYMKDFSIHS